MIALSTVVALYALASRLARAADPILSWVFEALEQPEARAVLMETQGQDGYTAVDQIRLALETVAVPPYIQRAVLAVVMYATEILGIVEGSMSHEALLLQREHVMNVDESGDAEIHSYVQARQLADWSEDMRENRFDGNLAAVLMAMADAEMLPLSEEEMGKVRAMCMLAGLSEGAVENPHLATVAWLTMLQTSDNLRDLAWFHNRAIPALVATGEVDTLAETMGRVFVPRHDDFNFPVEDADTFELDALMADVTDYIGGIFGLDDDDDGDHDGGITA